MHSLRKKTYIDSEKKVRSLREKKVLQFTQEKKVLQFTHGCICGCSHEVCVHFKLGLEKTPPFPRANDCVRMQTIVSSINTSGCKHKDLVLDLIESVRSLLPKPSDPTIKGFAAGILCSTWARMHVDVLSWNGHLAPTSCDSFVHTTTIVHYTAVLQLVHDYSCIHTATEA